MLQLARFDRPTVLTWPRFLEADSAVRDMGSDGRNDMAQNIAKLLPSLDEYPFRWFVLLGEGPLMIWLQREHYVDFVEAHKVKAEAVAITSRAPRCKLLTMYVKADGSFAGEWAKYIEAPKETDARYPSRLAYAKRMEGRSTPLTAHGVESMARQGRLG